MISAHASTRMISSGSGFHKMMDSQSLATAKATTYTNKRKALDNRILQNDDYNLCCDCSCSPAPVELLTTVASVMLVIRWRLCWPGEIRHTKPKIVTMDKFLHNPGSVVECVM
jgi:hypothetical protein